MKIQTSLPAFSLSLVLFCLFAVPSFGASRVSVTGQLPTGYESALFYTKQGYVTEGQVKGKKFTLSVANSDFKSGSIVLLKAGKQFGGTVVLAQKGSKSFTQLGSPAGKKVALGSIVVSPKGYLKLKTALIGKAYDAKGYAQTNLLGAPLGLNKTGNGRLRGRATTGDSDRDGVPDSVDVDSDGDGAVDGLTTGATSTTQAPYMVVREGMAVALNVQANGIPEQTAIDTLFSSGNNSEFAMGFGFSVREDVGSIQGAHVVCSDTDTLCGRAAGLATVNGGASPLWKNYHPDGSTYPGLELASSNPSEKFFNTGITPHVGPSVIQPGTTYRIEFSGASGAAVRSQIVSLAPYLVTVPALHTYSANGTDHAVDYAAIATEAGAASNNPIVLGSDGVLQVNFWRPQRQRLGGSDGAGYIDVGHLRYGIVIMGPASGGGSGEKSCAGNYSLLSSTLSDHASGQPNDFWPLHDSADDTTPDVTNVMSFSVDLKSCLAAAGYAPGSYIVSLQASGPDLGHGANRSGEDFFVTVVP